MRRRRFFRAWSGRGMSILGFRICDLRLTISQHSAVSMQPEAPLTLILSPLRAGRGELERTCLGSLFGDPDTMPPKVPLSLRKRERVRVRVRVDCMDTAKANGRWLAICFCSEQR